MSRLSIDDIQIGMILDEAIKNSNGVTLLPAGVEIGEKHIKAMKMWGIPDVKIQADNDNHNSDEEQVLDPEKFKIASAEMSERFRHTDLEHPAMRDLFKIATIRHAKNS